MKTRFRTGLLPGIAILVVAGCSRSSYNWTPPSIQTIFGSGVIVEDIRPVSGFSQTDFSTAGSLRLEQGAEEALRIRGDDNLLPYVITEVQGGMLTMRTRTGFDLQETQPMEFWLTVADLNRFDFAGVGDAELSNLSVTNLTMHSAGIGSIECSTLDAIGLDVTMSGIGNVSISGEVDWQVIRVAHFGDYDASALVSREATVTIGSMGSATVRVSDRLEVNLVGGGSVFYIGDPVLVISGSGSGSVQKIG